MIKRLLLFSILLCLTASAQNYDVVIHGGRVLDPETGLDAVRDVGISGGKIARVSETPLTGKRTIDAKGLVVAPGFIDLHQHGQDVPNQRLKAFDGVTSALELEIGSPDVTTFLQNHRGKSLINYGSSASHAAARAASFGAPLPMNEIIPQAGPATNDHTTPQQWNAIEQRLEHEIAAGALGVGIGLQYTPGATRSEIIHTFDIAARHHLPIFVHIRSAGRVEPGSSIEAVSEMIGAAAVSGAPLHIVHVNSMCMKDVGECLEMIAGARARGLDVTTEAYPYIAGMTYINSALFNPGWQQKMGISYGELMLPDTGERLTKERFDELHAKPGAQLVVLFNNTEEADDAAITNPLVMIASDGEMSHPRGAGTYSKILSRYVRQQHSLTLMDAIRKMTLMPAQRLEGSTPEARNLGRIQQGADADIVIFNANEIQDRSTFSKPAETSVGVKYLLVGGTVLIDNAALAPNTFPGRAITSR